MPDAPVRFLIVAGLAALFAGVGLRAAAQAAWEEVAGPTYSARQIRGVEIEGLHLGMTEHEVHDAMAARRFQLHNPTGAEGAGHFIAADGRSRMILGYTGSRPRRILSSYTYEVHYTADEVSDIEARRTDLIRLLGHPTHWERWTNERNEIADRFHYVSDRELGGLLEDAASCYANWRCASLRRELDCRPIVRRVRGAVIEGGFGGPMLHITVSDYGAEARELLSDSAFRRRDLSDAMCGFPLIH